MATLIIRDLDDAVHERLRIRAVRNGRSMESEASGILAECLASGATPAIGLGSRINGRFAGDDVALDVPVRAGAVRGISFVD